MLLGLATGFRFADPYFIKCTNCKNYLINYKLRATALFRLSWSGFAISLCFFEFVILIQLLFQTDRIIF